MTSFTMHVPLLWAARPDRHGLSASAFDPYVGGGQIEVSDLTATSLENVQTAERDGVDESRLSVKKVQRLPNRKVDGVEGYVLVGHSHEHPVYYQYGTVHAGRIVAIELSWELPTPHTHRIIESVLASVRWHD